MHYKNIVSELEAEVGALRARRAAHKQVSDAGELERLKELLEGADRGREQLQVCV